MTHQRGEAYEYDEEDPAPTKDERSTVAEEPQASGGIVMLLQVGAACGGLFAAWRGCAAAQGSHARGGTAVEL